MGAWRILGRLIGLDCQLLWRRSNWLVDLFGMDMDMDTLCSCLGVNRIDAIFVPCYAMLCYAML